MTTRAAWVLALALVACGADDTGALHFDGPGVGGHGGNIVEADAATDAPVGVVEDAGPDGLGGFGGSSDDAGTEGDAEPVEDAGPDTLEDAAPDVSDDAEADSGHAQEAGPVGPPYSNPNVGCRVKEGNGANEYRCDDLYPMRWSMRYEGSDGVWHRCTGSPEDDDAPRPPCPKGNECTVYKKDDAFFGTCIE